MRIEFPGEKVKYLDNGFKGALHRLRKVLYLIGALVVLGVVFFVKNMGQDSRVTRDYLQIESLLRKLGEGDSSAMRDLLGIRNARPELKPLIDPKFQQSLILSGEGKVAYEIGHSMIERLQSLGPLYQNFALASLEIDMGNLEEAYEVSIALHKDLSEKVTGSYARLASFNLIRIFLLERALGKVDKSCNGDNLKELLQNASISEEVQKEMMAHFGDEGVTLFDYISSV